VRLLLVCVGRLKAGPERALAERYLERAGVIGRNVGIAIDEREIEESRARRAQERSREEAKAIRSLVGEARFIACDPAGKSLTSEDFAAELGRSRDRAISALAIAIGGPDGLDRDLRRSADLLLAFGTMTWPHQLARIMLAEQIYRATTILAGHPYHRI